MDMNTLRQIRNVAREFGKIPSIYREVRRDIRREVDRFNNLTSPWRRPQHWKPYVPPPRRLHIIKELLKILPPLGVLIQFGLAVKDVLKHIKYVSRDIRQAFLQFRPALHALQYFSNSIQDTCQVVSQCYRTRSRKRFYRGIVSGYKLLTGITKFVFLMRKLSWKSHLIFKRRRKHIKHLYKILKEMHRPRRLFKTVKRIILRRKPSVLDIEIPEKKKSRPYVWDLFNKVPVSDRPVHVYSYTYKCFRVGETLHIRRNEGSIQIKKIDRRPFITYRIFPPSKNSIKHPLELERKLYKINP